MVSGCGSDAPEAEKLPLAPGLRVVSHEVRGGVAETGWHGNYLLITGADGMRSTVIRSRELEHLRELGWKFHRAFHDGSRRLVSPDDQVRADVGFGRGTYCGFGGVKRTAPPGYPSICAVLANH